MFETDYLITYLKITGKAAAEKLGCSRACLYKWAEQEREPKDVSETSAK